MVSPTLFSSRSEEWATPQKLYDQLHQEFCFTLDPSATDENAKCPRYFTIEDNGLVQDWSTDPLSIPPGSPFELFSSAHLLIQHFSAMEHMFRDGHFITPGTTPICDSELHSKPGLDFLNSQKRHEQNQQGDCLLPADIPCPRDSLIQFSRLVTANSPNLKYAMQEVNRWLMHQLDSDAQTIVGRSFLSARSLDDALCNMYESLSIKEASGPGNQMLVNFHTVIIPSICRFIKQRVLALPSTQHVFLNPPYGRVIAKWMQKIATSACPIAVALVHARTDTRWWHWWVEPYADEIRHVKGRVKFGGSSSSTFPSVVIIYRQGKRQHLWGRPVIQ